MLDRQCVLTFLLGVVILHSPALVVDVHAATAVVPIVAEVISPPPEPVEVPDRLSLQIDEAGQPRISIDGREVPGLDLGDDARSARYECVLEDRQR